MKPGTEFRVQLFGQFRSLSPVGEVIISLSDGATAVEAKLELEGALAKSAVGATTIDLTSLLARSVLADETHILDKSEKILPGMVLAVLPPVCGG